MTQLLSICLLAVFCGALLSALFFYLYGRLKNNNTFLQPVTVHELEKKTLSERIDIGAFVRNALPFVLLVLVLFLAACTIARFWYQKNYDDLVTLQSERDPHSFVQKQRDLLNDISANERKMSAVEESVTEEKETSVIHIIPLDVSTSKKQKPGLENPVIEEKRSSVIRIVPLKINE